MRANAVRLDTEPVGVLTPAQQFEVPEVAATAARHEPVSVLWQFSGGLLVAFVRSPEAERDGIARWLRS